MCDHLFVPRCLRYNSMCGPREMKLLAKGSALAELGYTADMVTKL